MSVKMDIQLFQLVCGALQRRVLRALKTALGMMTAAVQLPRGADTKGLIGMPDKTLVAICGVPINSSDRSSR